MNKILNFHLVDNIEWFDKTIAMIKSKYNMVSMDELIAYYDGKINLKNACHITVDDGDQTFYNTIYPVLKKYQVPASLYVSPKIFKEQINFWFQEVEGYHDHTLKNIIAKETHTNVKDFEHYDIFTILKTFKIEKIHQFLSIYRAQTKTPLKPYQNMSIAELKEVDKNGLVTIGGHTMNHPILLNETDESSAYEINNSLTELSELLGHPIKCFSYPNGIFNYDFSEREQNFLIENNVKLTFTTIAKNFNRSDHKMAIPRIGVSNNEKMLFLKIKLFLGSLWDNLKKIKATGEYKQRIELQKIFNAQ
ncbi:hypothetical protein A5893_02725 [Pedobacter psychrophilus]|uniref:NodB homology domain-containing protein n=1 Tax=Pedobacter psychrophilus TaxID=1826909 RepID=A0A179DLX4_9SPHI|nr:polysaccharide deacetylase family protein [Pedobacter psychrophilus]OAQ42047.1 hypothetical protein A5893_02725 [Pedobacter psychrophilus]